MRFLKSTLCLFALIFHLGSCSNDDSPQDDENFKVLGTYILSAVNVSPNQDINEDGTASTNLLDEMTCITGTLTINSDASWDLNIVRISVTSFTGGMFFIDCGNADTSQGTWTFSNNQLNLNGSTEPTVYSFNEDTLTRQIGDDLPGFQSVAFTK